MNTELSPLFAQLRSYKKARVLAVALHKGVLSSLESNCLTLEDLAQKVELNSEWLLSILGVLAGEGLVDSTPQGYRLTDLGRKAVEDQALMAFAGYHYHCFPGWERLPELAEQGGGGRQHEAAEVNPDFTSAYLDSLDAIAQVNAGLLVDRCRVALQGRTLDVGCGPATVTRLLAQTELSVRVTALDLPAVSALARQKYAICDAFNWEQGDFWTWNAKRPFDAIYCSHFLEYTGIGRIQSFLKRLQSFVVPGGSLVFVTFIRNRALCPDLDLFELSTGLNGDTLGHLYTGEEFKSVLDQSGLELVAFDLLPQGPSYQEVFVHCRTPGKEVGI